MTSKQPSSAPRLVVHDQGPGHCFATWRNVLIAVWTTQGTGPLADALGKVAAPFAAAHPEGFSSVHIIGHNPPLPTSEAREKLIALIRNYADQVGGIGTVLEGQGFWASAVRSFIIGIRLVVPRTFDMQIYASIAELSQWLPAPHATKTGVTLDSVELERAFREARRQLA